MTTSIPRAAENRLDLKRELRHVYTAGSRPAIVDVPAIRYVAVDGVGDPSSTPRYVAGVKALYSAAYKAKRLLKNEDAGIDVTVMPLEGLWWSEDPSAFVRGDRESWRWTLMIAQPVVVSDTILRRALGAVSAADMEWVGAPLYVMETTEGQAAQLLHIGPYDTEARSVARLHHFIENNGLRLRGPHHEVYLSDPRRTDRSRLRTILRQPVSGR